MPVARILQEFVAGPDFVERDKGRAIGCDPLVNFEDSFVKHRRKNDVASEDFGPRLISDPQGIPEASGHRERNAFSFPLEKSVGRDRRAHPDLRDGPSFLFENAANRFQGRVFILSRIFRQKFEELRRFPSEEDATTSVNVPPRSIAKTHARSTKSLKQKPKLSSIEDGFIYFEQQSHVLISDQWLFSSQALPVLSGLRPQGRFWSAARRLSGSIISMIITILL